MAVIAQDGYKSLIFIVVPHYIHLLLLLKLPWQESLSFFNVSLKVMYARKMEQKKIFSD